MLKQTLAIVVLIALATGFGATCQGAVSDEEAGTIWALGLTAHAGLGVLGDSFAMFGVGSAAALQDGIPVSEFSYQLSAIRLSGWETVIRLGGLAARMALKPDWSVSPVLGVRFHRLPYVSGFYIRTRWTLGIETGAIAEIFPGAWARLSLVMLLDKPLLTGYGYPGSGATGIELAVGYYVPIRQRTLDGKADVTVSSEN